MEYYGAIRNNEIFLYTLTKNDVHDAMLSGKFKLQKLNNKTVIPFM